MPRLNPHHAAVDLGRWPEIVAPHLRSNAGVHEAMPRSLCIGTHVPGALLVCARMIPP